jgi:hypothetical protein
MMAATTVATMVSGCSIVAMAAAAAATAATTTTMTTMAAGGCSNSRTIFSAFTCHFFHLCTSSPALVSVAIVL